MKRIRVISLVGFSLFVTSLVFFSCNKFKNTPLQTAYLPEEIPDYGSGDQQLNEMTHLGRVLFYDPALSKNNTISCASCHKQAYAFADNASLSTGFENHKTKRNSIAIQNIGFDAFGGPFFGNTAFFWDGRESKIESLISKPISNHVEMGMDDHDALLTKLNARNYISQLSFKAFGDKELNMANLSAAMVKFLQLLNTQSKFDVIMGMNVPTASFTAQELRGKSLFMTTYQCTNCHHPAPGVYSNFGDFVNIGLDASSVDEGRKNITQLPSDEGRFKIPDLHNVAITAPYMHDGRFKTLNDVLNHYSHGIQPNNNLDPRLMKDGQPLRMNISEQDKEDIIAFLNTMTDYKLMTNSLFSNPFKLK